jgi:hypothetical protein
MGEMGVDGRAAAGWISKRENGKNENLVRQAREQSNPGLEMPWRVGIRARQSGRKLLILQ